VVTHYLGMHLDLFQRLVVTTASVTALGFGPVPYLLRLSDSGMTRDLNPPPESRQPSQNGERDDASA
jgi:hypothetical protein